MFGVLVLIVKNVTLSWWNSSAHLTGVLSYNAGELPGKQKAGGYSLPAFGAIET